MSNNGKDFKYTYSSAEQAEVRRIREKYSPKEIKEEDALTRLRRLDAEVTNKASAVSLVFGVIGILILGLGMSLIMSDLSVKLGISHPLALTQNHHISSIIRSLAKNIRNNKFYHTLLLFCIIEKKSKQYAHYKSICSKNIPRCTPPLGRYCKGIYNLLCCNHSY